MYKLLLFILLAPLLHISENHLTHCIVPSAFYLALYRSIISECGGLFSITKGKTISIFSPKTASGFYPPNMNCQWTVMAAQTSILNVSFAYMEIEDCSIKFYDYIEIYQGFRKDLELQAKTCTNTVKNFNITGDVTIRFHSDSSYHRAGFNIIVSDNSGFKFSPWFYLYLYSIVFISALN